MVDSPSRHIELEFVGNLRDLGGHITREGRRVARGKLYRSAEPRHESLEHVEYLKKTIGLATVIDLRGEAEIRQEPIDFYRGAGVRYENVPFIAASLTSRTEPDVPAGFSCMGEFYLHMLRDHGYNRKIIRALEIIADPRNHSVLYHCAVGKDRTGILSAFVLSILGVSDEDIIEDYTLTTPSMEAFITRLKAEPGGQEMYEKLPSWMWESTAASMELFLSELQREHGSLRACLEARGAGEDLFDGLKQALLE